MLELTEELIRASAVASTGSAQVTPSTASTYRICRAGNNVRGPRPGHSGLLSAALAACWPQLTPCCHSVDVHPFCGWGCPSILCMGSAGGVRAMSRAYVPLLVEQF